jgi:hypothetical protein
MPFLLSYFRTPDEALHLAWSEDGLGWRALNDNQAVLRATVGNRWGACQSHDLLRWQAMEGLNVPPEARHGSVLSVSAAQLAGLRRQLSG